MMSFYVVLSSIDVFDDMLEYYKGIHRVKCMHINRNADNRFCEHSCSLLGKIMNLKAVNSHGLHMGIMVLPMESLRNG
jgi:hypothetical protein